MVGVLLSVLEGSWRLLVAAVVVVVDNFFDNECDVVVDLAAVVVVADGVERTSVLLRDRARGVNGGESWNWDDGCGNSGDDGSKKDDGDDDDDNNGEGWTVSTNTTPSKYSEICCT